MKAVRVFVEKSYQTKVFTDVVYGKIDLSKSTKENPVELSEAIAKRIFRETNGALVILDDASYESEIDKILAGVENGKKAFVEKALKFYIKFQQGEINLNQPKEQEEELPVKDEPETIQEELIDVVHHLTENPQTYNFKALRSYAKENLGLKLQNPSLQELVDAVLEKASEMGIG